jgi:folylpolyglutamate synthase/dihydropteroate synthase
VGASAYKEGLENTLALDHHFNHPHRQYKTIHIAGTNGKGSCSHTIASILQEAGYKVGLYTSPHLVDFRERIRVNGQCVSEKYVIDFIEHERSFFEPLHPSFFELTTAMAFKYFAEQQVDVAVIEVGLGGRLDCTNIISPILSVITNISFDHTGFLGDTLAKIASEKAGIIKKGVPVVIGEYTDETRPVFEKKAKELNAPITFAQDCKELGNDIAFEIRPRRKPLGICTSSAKIGHSISFGDAESVTVISDYPSVADALATRIANDAVGDDDEDRVSNPSSAAEEFREFFDGVLIVSGEYVATVGRLPRIVETNEFKFNLK